MACERLTYSGVELGQKKKAFDGELARRASPSVVTSGVKGWSYIRNLNLEVNIKMKVSLKFSNNFHFKSIKLAYKKKLTLITPKQSTS